VTPRKPVLTVGVHCSIDVSFVFFKRSGNKGRPVFAVI
jgi:hypothetical protein